MQTSSKRRCECRFCVWLEHLSSEVTIGREGPEDEQLGGHLVIGESTAVCHGDVTKGEDLAVERGKPSCHTGEGTSSECQQTKAATTSASTRANIPMRKMPVQVWANCRNQGHERRPDAHKRLSGGKQSTKLAKAHDPSVRIPSYDWAAATDTVGASLGRQHLHPRSRHRADPTRFRKSESSTHTVSRPCARMASPPALSLQPMSSCVYGSACRIHKHAALNLDMSLARASTGSAMS
jgi:hypothetical protein